MKKLLLYISEHKYLSLAIYFVLFLALLIAFVQIADEVFEGDTLWFDTAVLTAVNGQSTAFFDTFFIAITQIGGVVGIIAITTALLVVLIKKRYFAKALILGATVAGAALLNVILKLIFERTRPDLWEQLVVETSYSFPSGHAMASAALAGAVIAICWSTRFRWLAIIFSVSFILLIGFSRLYLGVHYPTDVLAGWVVSTAWLLLVLVVVHSRYLRNKAN
jgi:membrane-associated phospholipid phosphatase